MKPSDETSSGVLWQLGDYEGSIRDIVSATSGAVTGHTVYGAYGQVISTTGTPGLIGYAGGMNDAATGTVHFAARDYDPKTGRWTQPDPSNSDPPNAYWYARNNPVNAVDRDGLMASFLGNVAAGFSGGFLPSVVSNVVSSSYDTGGSFGSSGGGGGGGGGGNYSGSASYGIPLTSGLESEPALFNSQEGESLPSGFAPDPVWNNTADMNIAQRVYVTVGAELGKSTGVTALDTFLTARDPVTGTPLGWKDWLLAGGTAAVKLPLTALGIKAGAGLLAGSEASAARSGASGYSGSSGFELRNSPLQPVRNAAGEVNGQGYSGHAFDQMQNKGIPPSVVENTVQNGIQMIGKEPGTTAFYDPFNNVTVINNSSTGNVVTVSRGLIKQ